MISAARRSHAAAGRCIYCAFRSRQIALQARRLGSTYAAHGNDAPTLSFRPLAWRTREDADKTGLIRKTSGPPSRRPSQGRSSQGRPPRGRPGGEQQQDFQTVLRSRLGHIKEELEDSAIYQRMQTERIKEGEKEVSFGKSWKQFTASITTKRAAFFGFRDSKGVDDNVLEGLIQAYRDRGQRGLDNRIKYAFYGHVTGARFTESELRNQKALADLRYPSEWFPATRIMQRSIHLHVGPTNSGKTYSALQRLEQAESGVYAGPLRLLAHEVYARMNAKGIQCALITGEERRLPEGQDPNEFLRMKSCTVEMMPLNQSMDVAVIDEIQMIGNADRGWAWTQALLGVKAKEIHLCGEERTVPLIQELCASTGDKLEVHHYERLSPLQMAESSLKGNLKQLRKGDCIVSFSVMGIHALRRQIEQSTGKKVAIVYGSLPPETRAQQARLFNDPDNDYDFLVASDAVGMGLNLAIKRIIFEASHKFDGTRRRTLAIADIKQIGGRAGRFRTAAQATEQHVDAGALAAAKVDKPAGAASDSLGLVTTLEDFDFSVVSEAMSSEPEPIRTAGIFPPGPVLERFASYFPPGTPFSYVLTRLHEQSQMHKRFHLCGLKDQIWLADLIEPVEGLTITDRNTMCAAPASQTDVDLWRTLMPAYARIVVNMEQVDLVNIPELPLEVLEAPVSASRDYLRELERLHKGIVTYLWLSYRFAGVFGQRGLAFHVKSLVEEKIETVLNKFSFTEAQRKKIASKRESLLLKGLIEDTAPLEGQEQDSVTGEDVRVVSEEANADDGVERDDLDSEHDVLHQQTTLTAGGDRFGGEEDIDFEEPGEAEALVSDAEDKRGSVSFSEWREKQVRDESQTSLEEEDTLPPSEDLDALKEEVASQTVDTNLHESFALSLDEQATTTDPVSEPVVAEPDMQEQLPLETQEVRPRTELEPPVDETAEESDSSAPVDTATTQQEDADTHLPSGTSAPGLVHVKHIPPLERDGQVGEGGRDSASRH